MSNGLLSQIAAGGTTGPSPVDRLLQGRQFAQQQQTNALQNQLLQAQLAQTDLTKQINALSQQALSGDRGAIAKIAGIAGPQAAQNTMATVDAMRKRRSEDVARYAVGADTPEKWDAAVDELSAKYPDLAQYKGKFSPELRQRVINQARPISDIFAQPFSGAGMEAQSMNTVIMYNQKKSNGIPTTPQEDMAYNLASQRLGQPKIVTLASGEQVVYPGMDLSSISGGTRIPTAQGFGGIGGVAGPLGGRVISQKPYTEGQTKSAEFANRMNIAEGRLSKLQKTYDPTSVKDWAASRVPFGNFMMSPKGQLYKQAQEDWVRAKLRLESGAAIGDAEMEQEIKTYFPQPGDTPEVVKQKAAARRTAIDNLQKGSQGAYERMFPGSEQQGRTETPPQKAPQSAIDYLKQNPQFKEQFREKYGYIPEGM